MKSIRMLVAAGREEMRSLCGLVGSALSSRGPGRHGLTARHDPSTAQRHRPADLERIVALRRQRCTGQHIAHEVGVRRRR